jgi:hypothetical protein
MSFLFQNFFASFLSRCCRPTATQSAVNEMRASSESIVPSEGTRPMAVQSAIPAIQRAVDVLQELLGSQEVLGSRPAPRSEGVQRQVQQNRGRGDSEATRNASVSSVQLVGSSQRSRAHWTERAVECRFHLRYIVSAWLNRQKEDASLALTDAGAFPQTVKWWDLFLEGLEAEGLGGAQSYRNGVDGIAAESDWDEQYREGLKEQINRLSRIRQENSLTMAAFARGADPYAHLIPWVKLTDPELALEPRALHKFNQGAPIWLYGDISSVVCDCEDGEDCKFQPERDARPGTGTVSFLVAAAHAWCPDGEACECREGFMNALVPEGGVVACSWTCPVGKVPHDLPQYTAFTPGESYEWPETMIDRRKEHQKKPEKKRGRKPLTDEEKAKREAAKADAKAQKKAARDAAKAARDAEKAEKKAAKKRTAGATSERMRKSMRPTAGKHSNFDEYDTRNDVSEDGSADDCDV